MVFLIQNAQNRESKALHLKLDELILSARRARNELIDIELLTDEQLDRLGERYRRISESCHRNLDDDAFLHPAGEPDPAVLTAAPARLGRPCQRPWDTAGGHEARPTIVETGDGRAACRRSGSGLSWASISSPTRRDPCIDSSSDRPWPCSS